MSRAPRSRAPQRRVEKTPENGAIEGAESIRVNGVEIQRPDVNALMYLEDAVVAFSRMSDPIMDRRQNGDRMQSWESPDYSANIDVLSEANSRVMNYIGLETELGGPAETTGALDNLSDEFLLALVKSYSDNRYDHDMTTDRYEDNIVNQGDQLAGQLMHYQTHDASIQNVERAGKV